MQKAALAEEFVVVAELLVVKETVAESAVQAD